jgi:cell division protein FtsB
MPFLALLKLISPKEWLVLIALIALAAGGAWLYRHGEQHIEAQDAKLAAIDQRKVAVVETTAKDMESHNDVLYKQTVSAPAVASVGIKCVRNAASAVPLPASNTGSGTAARDAITDSGSGPTYDPSGPALTRARKADAQIKYLQARIRELESEMNGAP